MADGLIKAAQWGEIAGLYRAGALPMPFVQEIFLLQCDIAGTGFVKNIHHNAAGLAEGSPLVLVREPENKFDAMAIRVDSSNGGKLGFIPRKKNEILARLMDGGKMLYAKVVTADVSELSEWADITIKIFMKDL